MPTTRINQAIQECLNQCRGSDVPLARLARFSEELRQSGWKDADIRAVEMAVVRLLSALSDTDIPVDDG